MFYILKKSENATVQLSIFCEKVLNKMYSLKLNNVSQISSKPGGVAQSVTCLVPDASLTADPGVASSIPARSHSFVEIDHVIIFYDHSPPFR